MTRPRQPLSELKRELARYAELVCERYLCQLRLIDTMQSTRRVRLTQLRTRLTQACG